MDIINYSSGSALFNDKTSVLLDACFLLALYDRNDIKHSLCNQVIKELREAKSSVYVSTSITAEVVNKLILQLYINDMMYKINNTNGLNSNTTIGKLQRVYSVDARRYLKCKPRVGPYNRKINYNKGLRDTYKDTKLCSYLNVYIENANKMLNYLILNFNIKYISINKDCFVNSQVFMSKYILGVNDAVHLASSIQTKMTYLITLDGDFQRVTDPFNVKLLKI